jgi:hypothetical protein
VCARTERVALNHTLGRRVTVARRERRREHVVSLEQWAELPSLVRGQHPRVQAGLVLQRHAGLERGDVVGTVEDEQIPDLLEVDLPTGTAGEVAKGGHAALRDLDVEHIRELGAHATRGPERRSAPELPTLDQDDLDAGLGEVKGRARADDPAPMMTAAADSGSGRSERCTPRIVGSLKACGEGAQKGL